jgi:hypothetical protein
MMSTADEATAIREWVEQLLFGHAHRLFRHQRNRQDGRFFR